MKHFKSKLIFCLLLAFEANAQGAKFEDPYGIGSTPTLPSDYDPNAPLEFLKDQGNTQVSQIPQPLSQNQESVLISDPVAIMSSGAGVLTVWAPGVNNWIWGYTLFDSITLDTARVWRILTHKDGSIQIKNELTGFCLCTYGNGVIHTFCNPNDRDQFWTINTFDNQALQLKNVGQGTCLQTPSSRRGAREYYIYTVPCADSTQPNLDQQWFFIAPTFKADHIFTLN